LLNNKLRTKRGVKPELTATAVNKRKIVAFGRAVLEVTWKRERKAVE
jgi:RecB family exonuclease